MNLSHREVRADEKLTPSIVLARQILMLIRIEGPDCGEGSEQPDSVTAWTAIRMHGLMIVTFSP